MKTIYIASALAIASIGTAAQTYEDALRFNSNEVMGTARSQAMASAFGSLGADLTAMTQNPAGMGVYRATELAITLGVNTNKTETNLNGNKSTDDRISVPFSQVGANFSIGLQREATQGLVGSNFFLGYNRLADFHNNTLYRVKDSKNSLLDLFCMNGQVDAEATGLLAYNAYLTNDTNGIRYNVWEKYDPETTIDSTFRTDYMTGLGMIDIDRRLEQEGSKGEFTLGYAANISNKVFIGGSMGIQMVHYNENLLHSEEFFGYTEYIDDPTKFAYKWNLDQDATGVNFKLGVIVKPVNALRIGLAIHSPTFFNVEEVYTAQINNPSLGRTYKTELENEYKYRTAGRFIASISGVIGKSGLISIDYERTDNKKGKFSTDDDFADIKDEQFMTDITEDIKEVVKATNTIRVGAEVSALQPLYLRAGFRFSTENVSKEYYWNKPKEMAFTGGIGFRSSNFFADIAYVSTQTEGDSFVLPNSEYDYPYDNNIPAKTTKKGHRGVITIGFRF